MPVNTANYRKILALVALAGIGQMYAQQAGTPAGGAGGSLPKQKEALTPGQPRAAVLAYCTDLTGGYGAINVQTTLVDSGKFSVVDLIDADVTLPTGAALRSQYDCVIAMTDNRCGGVSNSTPMADFVGLGGGVVIATFGYSTTIGFTSPIFAAGLSPFLQVNPFNASAGTMNIAGASTTGLCAGLTTGVTGTVSSTYANTVSLASGATLCASYNNGQGLLAVNATSSVLGLNTFPNDAGNNTQASYRNLVSNVVSRACSGARASCGPHTVHGHLSTHFPNHLGGSHQHHGQHGHTVQNTCIPHGFGHTPGLTAEAEGLFFTELGPPDFVAVLNQESKRAPVRRGTVAQLFGSAAGLFVTDDGDRLAIDFTPPISGSPLYYTTLLPEVRVGGALARVLFSGLAPGLTGVWQINFEIPADAASGSVPVSISYDGTALRAIDIVVE